MPQCCAVPFCSEKKGGHMFPKDKTVLKQWIAAIRRDNYIPSKHSRVCKKHFIPDDYTLPKEPTSENPTPRLKPKTVPSRFAWNYESEERKEIKRKCAERVRSEKKCETATICSNEKNQCEMDFAPEEICEVEIDMSNEYASAQCSLSKSEDNSSNINLLEHESDRKNTINIFQIENLKERPDIVQFYTGFDNYTHFMSVFHLFGDEVNHLKYYSSAEPVQARDALTPCNQFFLTLIKLRRNMCNKELSFHFGISTTSVNKYFITWIDYLYCRFKDLRLWVPKKTIDQNVMDQRNTNMCTVIISANTLKVVVGISSSGCVSYVTEACPGSISDKELLEKCGIMNLLQKGDLVPGDRSFNKDLVSHMDTVNMPQLKDTDQFETPQIKKISEYVNVKRVIGLGRSFKILNNRLSLISSLGGRIIFVCYMLTNFRKNMM